MFGPGKNPYDVVFQSSHELDPWNDPNRSQPWDEKIKPWGGQGPNWSASAAKQALGMFGNIINRVGKIASDAVKNPGSIPQDYPLRLAALHLGDIPNSIFKGHASWEPTPPNVNYGFPPPGVDGEPAIKINFDSTDNPLEAASGAKLLPGAGLFYEPPAENNSWVSKLKQNALLNSPALTQGAKNYIEGVPYVEDPYYNDKAAGYSDSQYRMVGFNQPGLEEPVPKQEITARHEAMHQLAGVLYPGKKIAPFAEDFKKAVQANPQKYAPMIQWLKGYQNAMPDYFNSNPLNVASELFAEMGAVYGPSLLQDPNLRSYYKRIFVGK